MYIQKVKLKNFRNYINEEISLDENLNIFIGNNAQGKTNIVESIYLSAIGKSFRTNYDEELINFKSNDFTIDIEYMKNDRQNSINIFLEKEKHKLVKLNGIKIDKLSKILGNISVILFSPDELKVIKQSPNIRRKFFDISISQVNPMYLHYLLQYNKVLMQRNNLLKQIRSNSDLISTIDIWNEKLIELGMKVKKIRSKYIDDISKILPDKHKIISDNKEKLQLKYFPNCETKEIFREKLSKCLKYDIERGYTSNGIHKDDYVFYMNDIELNKFGSQGQQRSGILSYKLAEIDNMYEEFNEYPILLLDDVTSELDNDRTSKLLGNLKKYQTIITCTDIENFKILDKYKVFNVKEGIVREV